MTVSTRRARPSSARTWTSAARGCAIGDFDNDGDLDVLIDIYLPDGLVSVEQVRETLILIRAHLPLPVTARVPRPEDLVHLEATRRAVRAWGLEVNCADEREHSAALTGIRMPAGHDADRLRAVILERFDMSLGQGLGKLKGKLFRIGHLGAFNDLMLCGTLAGVEMGLSLAGVPHQRGGVAAALEGADVVVVASVSCIYGIGAPETYQGMHVPLEAGQVIEHAPPRRGTAGLGGGLGAGRHLVQGSRSQHVPQPFRVLEQPGRRPPARRPSAACLL